MDTDNALHFTIIGASLNAISGVGLDTINGVTLNTNNGVSLKQLSVVSSLPLPVSQLPPPLLSIVYCLLSIPAPAWLLGVNPCSSVVAPPHRFGSLL